MFLWNSEMVIFILLFIYYLFILETIDNDNNNNSSDVFSIFCCHRTKDELLLSIPKGMD